MTERQPGRLPLFDFMRFLFTFVTFFFYVVFYTLRAADMQYGFTAVRATTSLRGERAQ